MINKEIIYNADGTILKDFDNRNIPQYSHNSVCIGVLIPTSAFDVGEEQTIELAVKKCPSSSDEEITMFNLFGALSKVVNLQGIMYRKYTATLPYSYTDSIGSLKIAWVLKTIVQSGDTTTTTTVLTSNRCVVNVIKSVNNAQDETLETSVLDELEAQIEAKHVKEITEFNNSNETSLIYGLFSEYNFFGWLLQVKWNNKYVMVSPYQNGTDTELLVFANDGKVYRYTDITESSFTKTPLTLSKNEIGSLYVSKITTIANVQINNGISKEEMKSALDINDIEQDVADIISGDTVVKESEKATKDAQGNVIASTYAKISESGYSLSFTMDNNFVITVALKDKNNNTLSSGSIDLPIEDVGVVDMEYNPTTKKLILTLKNGRTIEVEVSEILSNVVQYQDIADNLTTESQYKVLSAKQGKILKGYADGLDARVSQIESTGSAVATLDNVVLDSDNWQETTTYPSFSYKYVITNQVFIGCVSVHLVLGVEDADSGNFASSVDIDKTNGKITLYARELPSEDITIPTILVYTGQNSYSGLEGRVESLENSYSGLSGRVSQLESTKKYQHNIEMTNANMNVLFSFINDSNIPCEAYGFVLVALEELGFKRENNVNHYLEANGYYDGKVLYGVSSGITSLTIVVISNGRREVYEFEDNASVIDTVIEV